jgi:hypothetical protein
VNAGLRSQLFFGIEMAVEAAMREARGLHHIRDAHAVDASLEHQFRGILYDLPMMCFNLLFGSACHGWWIPMTDRGERRAEIGMTMGKLWATSIYMIPILYRAVKATHELRMT